MIGTSRYTEEIVKRLPDIRFKRVEYPELRRIRFVDGIIKRFLYPVIVRGKIRKSLVKHITNQDLAFLLAIINIHPVVLTCYDLIPIAYYGDKSWYWILNIKGLQRADRIVTISEFSKHEIIRLTGYPADRIRVVYPGVDLTTYYPQKDRSILKNYRISGSDYVILFVGSEEPRKNISLLVRAMARLKKRLPNVKLIKVGGAQMGGDRPSLTRLIRDLDLLNDVIFTGQVNEKDLPKFYNAADLFVFPSFYEGFGLPPLEAMACGCPVITSDAASLPEVVGDAGIIVDPMDDENLAREMFEILTNETLKNNYVNLGLGQAKKYTWDRAAKMTEMVYREFQ